MNLSLGASNIVNLFGNDLIRKNRNLDDPTTPRHTIQKNKPQIKDYIEFIESEIEKKIKNTFRVTYFLLKDI